MTSKMPDVSPQNLYTGRETARHLGVNPHTLVRWKRSGKLLPFSPGGRYRGKDILDVWRKG